MRMKATNNVSLTQHATSRIRERFGVKKRSAAQSWADRHMAKAQYIANVTDKNGVESRMFVSGNISFILDAKADKIITVCDVSNDYHAIQKAEMKRKVSAFVRAEIDAIKATAQRSERKFSRTQAELQLELAERKLELLRARAPHRKLALQARINALQARADDMDAEIYATKRECTKSINGAVAYV
jgi:hypothetical protein